MGINAKLQQLFRHLLTSYWCIPVAFLLFAIGLAAGTIWLDHIYDGQIKPDFLYLTPVKPETARVVLSMIAGSIIGVAGVVFSITMVAVSFASGTFGPRLIGNMMRDRGSQISLGCFIGNFVYALIVLRFVSVGDNGEAAFAPYISIGLAMAMALFCMVVLIYFIHHVPETINIELIIAKLGRALKTGIESRFPGPGGPTPLVSEVDRWIDDVSAEDAIPISTTEDGYVQALDLKTIGLAAKEFDLRVKILCRPGAFVTASHPVMLVWHDSDDLAADARQKLQSAFALGASPTVNQNIEYIANQLVEIIARALSPGINDPFTAIACINWLRAGIEHFARHESLHHSFAETARVYSEPYLFSDFVNPIFEKALPYIVSNQQVTNHTDHCLQLIGDNLPAGSNKETIADIRERLKRAAKKEVTAA